MEVVIFLLLKTAGKAFPLFEAQDLLAELSLPPLKWKKEPFPPEQPWESAHILRDQFLEPGALPRLIPEGTSAPLLTVIPKAGGNSQSGNGLHQTTNFKNFSLGAGCQKWKGSLWKALGRICRGEFALQREKGKRRGGSQ